MPRMTDWTWETKVRLLMNTLRLTRAEATAMLVNRAISTIQPTPKFQ